MGFMLYSKLWVMQDLYHEPQETTLYILNPKP